MKMRRDTETSSDDGSTAGIDYAVVGPRDNRVHEIQTTRFPFRTICYLARDFGGSKWLGATGVLIAPTLVLTAGHCLYSHFRKNAPRRIAVIPARADRDTRPLGSMLADRFFVPIQYLFANSPRRLHYDYGVIRLRRPFKRIKRFMPVRVLSDRLARHILANRPITIAGYPSDRPIGTLWRHSERLKKVGPSRLYYTVDTCPGHSGSPVYYQSASGKHAIIGIHTSGIVDELGRPFGCRKESVLAPPGMLNSGIRITRRVLDDIIHPERSVEQGRMVRLETRLDRNAAIGEANAASTRL